MGHGGLWPGIEMTIPWSRPCSTAGARSRSRNDANRAVRYTDSCSAMRAGSNCRVQYGRRARRLAGRLDDELADVLAVEQHVDRRRQLLETLDDGLERREPALGDQAGDLTDRLRRAAEVV
jgi:hypothetical protein